MILGITNTLSAYLAIVFGKSCELYRHIRNRHWMNIWRGKRHEYNDFLYCTQQTIYTMESNRFLFSDVRFNETCSKNSKESVPNEWLCSEFGVTATSLCFSFDNLYYIAVIDLKVSYSYSPIYVSVIFIQCRKLFPSSQMHILFCCSSLGLYFFLSFAFFLFFRRVSVNEP